MTIIGQTIRVNLDNGVITTNNPVSLRNTAGDYNAIDKMTDVSTSGRTDGSALIYNATTDKYEVKPIIDALTGLDGGTF